MSKLTIPPELLEAISKDDGSLQELGIKIAKLYTDHGYPIDMSLDKLDHSRIQNIAILFGAQQWLIEHKRNSGATDKAIERQRKSNRETMKSFIETGETGIY